MPTCLELAQSEYPGQYAENDLTPVEGRSLLPIFRGQTRHPPEQLCWEWSGNGAIRQGDLKAVWDKLVKRWELYDLASDRTETHDLASEQPARVAQMVADYNLWAERTGNRTLPTPRIASHTR